MGVKQTRFIQVDEDINEAKAIDILNHFPGVGRRFERLKDGLYSD